MRPSHTAHAELSHAQDRAQERPFGMMNDLLLENHSRCAPLRRSPPSLLKLATPVENLSRHRLIGFDYRGQFRPNCPQIAKLARSLVLIDEAEVPAQKNGRQWQPTQKAFKCGARGAFPFEHVQPPQRRLKLRIEMAKQFRLNRDEVTLFRRPHD